MLILSILFLSFFSLTLALPTTPLPNNNDTQPESWVIPRLNIHMMSRHTGIPGDPPWPDSARFNTSMNFDITVPSHALNVDGTPSTDLITLNCAAEWENGTLPDWVTKCTGGDEGERVWFGLRAYTDLGPRRVELSFVLDVVRVWEVRGRGISTLSGAVPITANDPHEPSSFLTCLQGKPFDGLRCAIGSYLSVTRELVIDATPLEDDMGLVERKEDVDKRDKRVLCKSGGYECVGLPNPQDVF